MQSNDIIDLSEFSTAVNRNGIAYYDHVKTQKMDEPLEKMINNLKEDAKYEIVFEPINPEILTIANDLLNEDVEDFHENQFMDFDNLTSEIFYEANLNKN